MLSKGEIKMYVFINTDLKMSPGKACAQVGHVVQYIVEKIIREGYEKRPTPEYYQRYMLWKKEGCTKITKKATTEELVELMKIPEAIHVIDEGRTQIPKDSLTVVAFFPNYVTDMEFTKKFKLY